ncbi:zf-TFIIB domain-containing protein [bacterium]|nr:zf-TFIIB domain-containing protein [bacterium]
MDCPSDHTAMTVVTHENIDVEQCQQCGGEWLAHDELGELEAADESDPNVRAGMVEYLPNPSELACPVCSVAMYEFDYRGNPLELHACQQGHGYWLNAGDEIKIRQVLIRHAADLQRASQVEATFGHFLDNLRKKYGGSHRPLL